MPLQSPKVPDKPRGAESREWKVEQENKWGGWETGQVYRDVERRGRMEPVKIAIAGLGDRGYYSYGSYCAKWPEEARVVAIAEPIEARREKARVDFGVAEEMCFTDWKEMAAKGKLADAVVISTQDRMHTEPAVAFAAKGYHMILEKPMASTPEECVKIVEAVKGAGIVFAVGHVMRYSPYWVKMKQVIEEGKIGEVVAVQQTEPLGYWHQAHSFVRGNWGNSQKSSFMLLAKSCHDIDIFGYIVGKPCTAVSSFGGLKHFRKEEKPEGAAARCVDCAVEEECCYSAKKIYLTGETEWPVSSITDDLTPEGIAKAVEEGPYGRCVYECDNDVVDHQVVNLEYEGGATVSFIMCGLTRCQGRRTRVMGTKGEIVGNRGSFELFDFLTDKTTKYNPAAEAEADGHGGGDAGIMRDFLVAVRAGDPEMITTGPDETLSTHMTDFAAEESRLTGTVVKVAEYAARYGVK